jgi:phospholipid transport system substrate-binding protein
MGLLLQRMPRHRPVVSALAVALALAVSQLAWAPPSWAISPAVVLEAFFSRANTVLRSVDPERGLDEPRQAILSLVNEVFDFQGAAALALGPVWQSRTLEQQKEFVRLFTGFLERGYVAVIGSKASVADGVRIQFLGESVAGDSATVATTLLTRNGSELPVDYSMVRRGDRWAVRDVIIDGVSLVANYRAQFNRILRTASYADLLARMRTDAPEAPLPTLAAVIPASAAVPVAPKAEADARSQRIPEPTSPLLLTPAAIAQTGIRRELLLTVRPGEEAAPRDEHAPVRVSEPAKPEPAKSEPMKSEKLEPASKSRAAATYYWVQVGAFRTVDAAVQLADRLRRQGVTALHSSLSSAVGQPADMLARVRVGPFPNRTEALATLRELMTRGYAPFIAEGRD